MASFPIQTNLTGPLSSLRLQINQESEIFRDTAFISDYIRLDEFQYLVDVIIPSLLKRTFTISNKLEYKVTNVMVQFPTYCVNIKGEKHESKRLLTPFIAKETDQNYMCTIMCDILSINPTSGEILKDERSKVIDSFPCMVGSCRCITSHKPEEIESLDEWKMMLGEDPSYPGTYYIKAGAKKAVLYGEKLSTNTFITIETKGIYPKVETRITKLLLSKTFLLRVQSGKKRATVKILPPFLKGKHYPLFLVFYLISLQLLKQKETSFIPEKYIEYICSFAKESERESIEAYLNVSKDKFNSKFV